MKSVLYIEAFLILQIWTIVYPQRQIESRSIDTPVDTAAMRILIKKAQQAFIVDSLGKPIVSPQHQTESRPIDISVDTAAVRGTAYEGKQIFIVDSLSKPTDSTALAFKDTTAIDSVRIRFIPGMGQITSDVDSLNALHQKQFLWSDAKGVSDIIWKLPGFFYRDLGEAGKWGQLNAFGIDGRAIGILLDGRPMNDPVTGSYNLSDLPLEFIDHTEILTNNASIAALSPGTALNFVSRSYNSYRPLTKLRFVQDAKGTLLTDGLFTQNVARGLNLMIGFQRHVSDGRFANANLDAWNVRTRLRFNISDRLNIALTDFYTKAGNGLNGGALSEGISTEAGAKVYEEYVWDKRSRRDVTFNTIARILSDSSSTTQANLYYSTLEREYYNPSVRLIDDFTRSSFWGMRLQQQLHLDFVRGTIGGSWERRKSDSTRVLGSHLESEQSIFLQAELRLKDILVPSVSLRSTSLDGESSLSTGAGVKSAIADWLTLFADISWFDRFPTLQELYWSDSTFLRMNKIQKEQHEFLRGGFNLRAGSDLDINLTYFQRNVKRAIVFQPSVTVGGTPAISISNVREVVIQGINGNVTVRFYKFEIVGVLTLTHYKEVDTLKTLMPDIILGGEMSYRDTFFKNKLDAKFGVRSQFHNRQRGMQLDPQTLSYIQYNANILGRSTTLDLFMILKIGDAHLSLSWRNILNATYILSPIYPMPGRNIRFGVNWTFLD